MIALDTNILVRYFAQDDPVQSPLASTFVEEKLTAENPGFISPVVLVELIWVMQKIYAETRDRIVAIIETLLDAHQLVVGDAGLIGTALGHEGIGVADAIIHELGRAKGCSYTLTFDRNFSRLPQVELLTAWRAS